MHIIPVAIEILGYAFFALIGALVTGRFSILALGLFGDKAAAERWSAKFNQMTSYLRA